MTNPGFESSPVGSAPLSWTVVSASDAVVVVGTEGPASFPIYAQKGVTVAPFAEAQALRLGIPKTISQAQNKGKNTVTQTFVPAKSDLRLPLRAFSTDGRGDDHVVVDVTDGAGTRYPVSTESGAPFMFQGLVSEDDTICSRTPCDMEIETKSKNSFYGSPWQVMVIHNLPTDRSVTLKVSLETKSNGSHPSWLYVDGEPRNHPPVAQLSYNPGSKPGTIVQEGDFVVFSCAGSTDPDGDALTCHWHATGSTIPPLDADGQTAFFVFPDDDVIDMQLTVSDGSLTSTASASVTIANGAPLISTFDLIEVPEGGKGTALCRFLDPGVEDTHTVALSFNGTALATEMREENEPSLSSGYGKATIDVAGLAPGTYPGQCTVTDNDGAAASRSFTVNVLTAATIAARETPATNSSLTAPQLRAGTVVLSALENASDVDVFQIVTPTGGALPVGAEINVSVDVPADYDVILFSHSASSSTSPFVNAPFVSAPFVNAPFVNVPFVNAPFVNAPFVNAPFVNVPFVNAPFVSAPFVSAPFVSAPLETSPFVSAGYSFSNFPLSQVGLAAPDGGQVSGVDIGLGELGSYNLGALQKESLSVKGLSAQLGVKPERLLVRVGPGEDSIYLALVSHGGTFSPQPASIAVELATPPSQRQLLGARCDGAELVATGKTTSTTVLHDQGTPTTLIVTQRERFQATWGMSAADYDAWLALMTPFFDNGAVAARVVSVPSSAYDAADRDTCSVAKQNTVASQIRDVVRTELAAHPSIRYVQIMGGPDIVPPYYSPDETTISYEGLYASELWMQPGKPLGVALAEGYNPTDAYYADLNPQPFRGRELYIEDLPIGRLGERPAEILDSAQTFVAQNGRSIGSALATGYDFFSDGAEATASVLDGIAPVTRLIDDSWTASDVRCRFLGIGAGCASPDLTALNAHMSYDGLLSANGFSTGNSNDAVFAEESAGRLVGKTTLSIGCHSGLNFPDAWAIPQALAGLSFDPGRDWSQEAGNWIGPWTYGIGDDTVADRGTEGIVTLVAAEIAKGKSLGDALVRAKQRYATGLFEFGVYDEKSLIGLGLFGMPQSTFGIASAPAAQLAAGASSAVGTMTLDLLENGAHASLSYGLEQHVNDRGTWYALDGQAQGVFGRPLLPTAKPIEARTLATGDSGIHGVALRGGHYIDYLDVDPVFPTPRHDWTVSVDEPQPCVETASPAQLGVASTFAGQRSSLQTLIVQSGQFRCTVPAENQGAVPVTGEMRIYDSLALEALHPSRAGLDGDFDPPTVLRQDVTASAGSNDVTATLNASDANGMREIIGLVFKDADGVPGGEGTVTAYTTGDLTGTVGPYRLVLPGARNQLLAFQYIDAAGNLLMKSQKGALISAIEVKVLTTQIASSGPTSIQVFVQGYEGLGGVTLEMNFGDGSAPVTYDLSRSPLPAGVSVALTPPSGSTGSCSDAALVCDGVITVQNNYAAGSGVVTVTATLRANGAVGTAIATLSRCGDPAGDATANADIVGCAFSHVGTQVTIDMQIAGVISSGIYYKVVVGSQLFWYLNGVPTSPFGIPLTVTKLSSSSLRFVFDAKKLGWNGTTPFQFKERTVKFPTLTILDETAVMTGSP